MRVDVHVQSKITVSTLIPKQKVALYSVSTVQKFVLCKSKAGNDGVAAVVDIAASAFPASAPKPDSPSEFTLASVLSDLAVFGERTVTA